MNAIEQGIEKTKSRGLVWAAVTRFVTVALFFDALAPLFPQIAASHSLSDNFFQALLGGCYIAFACSQLASVPVIRVIGLYRTSALSCIFLGLATALIFINENAHLFAAVFISMFAVNSIGSNATRVVLRDATSDDGYKRLLAWASGAVEIMQIAMPLVAGVLVAAFGWRWALVALVAPVVIAGVWIEIVGRGQLGREDRIRSDASTSSEGSSWKAVLARPAFIIPTLIAASFQVAFSPLSARLPFILSNEAELSPAMVGLVLSLASGVVALGFFVSGYLVAHLSSENLIQVGIALMTAGLAFMSVGYIWHVYYTISGIILLQAAFGFIITPCSGDALNTHGQHRPIASAVFGFVQPMAGGFSVAMTGVLGLPQIGGSIGLTVVSIGLIFITIIVARGQRQAKDH